MKRGRGLRRLRLELGAGRRRGHDQGHHEAEEVRARDGHGHQERRVETADVVQVPLPENPSQCDGACPHLPISPLKKEKRLMKNEKLKIFLRN